MGKHRRCGVVRLVGEEGVGRGRQLGSGGRQVAIRADEGLMAMTGGKGRGGCPDVWGGVGGLMGLGGRIGVWDAVGSGRSSGAWEWEWGRGGGGGGGASPQGGGRDVRGELGWTE
ncbi:hypothetical protein Tco_1125374 [Tanacetum coccineum]|uniref:Uncharacterized protein n=1 Tax=Tanacetum coccineum TaxID=301880 RepID=A0ABQ5J9C8_9ASTR